MLMRVWFALVCAYAHVSDWIWEWAYTRAWDYKWSVWSTRGLVARGTARDALHAIELIRDQFSTRDARVPHVVCKGWR